MWYECEWLKGKTCKCFSRSYSLCCFLVSTIKIRQILPINCKEINEFLFSTKNKKNNDNLFHWTHLIWWLASEENPNGLNENRTIDSRFAVCRSYPIYFVCCTLLLLLLVWCVVKTELFNLCVFLSLSHPICIPSTYSVQKINSVITYSGNSNGAFDKCLRSIRWCHAKW